MRYVARNFALLSILPMLATGCSLRILGVDKSALTTDSGADGGSGGNSGINAFSVLGASGGSDTTADTYLTDGTTVTAEWVDTTGEDSYEVKILDGAGSTTLCGPATLAADATRAIFSSCALSHGTTYKIQVIAKNSSTGASQSAQASFQVGPFLSAGNLSANEWGIASIPVTLSYAVASPVTVQYVTTDGSALGGSDFSHRSLSTLTIPAGETNASIPVPIISDDSVESTESFHVALSSASGAGILSSTTSIQIQDNDLPAATNFTQVEAGGSSTCGLTTAGGVKCWGFNISGQLGDNTTTEKSTPNPVLGLSSGISQIALGFAHACAVSQAGAVRCWGDNANGQVGNNTVSNELIPVDVTGLSSGITQVAAGGAHTCALTSAGAVKCWGDNGSGQLGDSTFVDRLAPIDVSGLGSGVSQITLGSSHGCALTTAGGVKCWGYNAQGQLGDNSASTRNVPTDVFGLSSGVTQIAAGTNHTCALLSTGAAKCWGMNTYGQVGDNTITPRAVPSDVFGLSSGITQIDAGETHTCALLSTGSMKCWGYGGYGQLGFLTTQQSLVPLDVPGMSSGVIQISLGSYHSCALGSSATIRCWGQSANGRIGDGTLTNRGLPTDVSGLSSGMTQVSGGGSFTCALSSSGSVKCWGNNSYGQLGDNSQISLRPFPIDVPSLSSGVTQIVAGGSHACAISSGGLLQCWGYNLYGQLGNNTTTSAPVPTAVTGLSSDVTQVVARNQHTCALTSAGAVKCWGLNADGQIGDNSLTQRNIPTQVLGLTSGIAQVSIGAIHSCALSAAGAVSCWGDNSNGQLGDNSGSDRRVPTPVFGLSSGVSQIAAGTFHSCALTSAGAVLCWGRNDLGQLGDNSTSLRLVPTPVSGLSSGVTQIAAGALHTCAMTSTGAVKCWGSNTGNEIGDNTTTQRNVPTDVLGLSLGVTQISATNQHTCALTIAGGLKCWGYNLNAQIGDPHSNWIPQSVVEP